MTSRTRTRPDRRESPAIQSRLPAENGTDKVTSTADVIELAGVKETGSSFLGVLMTITREIRGAGGEAVLAHPSRDVEKHLAMMQMDDYWDVFGTVDEAKGFFRRNEAPHEAR